MKTIENLKDPAYVPDTQPLIYQEVGNYVVEPAGVFQKLEVKKKDGTQEIKIEWICYTPLIISACGHNIDTGEKSIQLEYLDTRKKKCGLWLSTKEALSRDLIKVTSWGINFAEKRCKLVNEYLSYFLYTNGVKIPEQSITNKNGWKNNNTMFVAGDTTYSAEGVAQIVNNGDKFTNYALKPRGDVSVWGKSVVELMEYPNVRFKCYVALTAPILRLLNQQSFLCHYYGDSSIGKSTISNIAMSQIGDPKTLEYSANSTQTGAERLAETYTDLPLNLDETSVAKPETLKAIVYMLSNERGRTRANRESYLRDVSTWKTTCLTTGETPITGDDTFTGAKLRVIEIYGGVGEESNDVKKKITAANGTIYQNYGHVLPLYLKYVFENKEELSKKFAEYKDMFKNTSNGSGTDSRLIDTFAAITTAGYVAEKVYQEIKIPVKDPVSITKDILKNAQSKCQTEKYTDKALEIVASWIQANSKFFISECNVQKKKEGKEEYDIISTSDDEKRYIIHGWIIKSNRGGVISEYIDVLPSVLRKFLTDAGYKIERCLEDWREKAVINCSPNRYTITQRHFDGVHRVIQFRKERLVTDSGGDDDKEKLL